MTIKIDLYLGGDLGLWAISQVPLEKINYVLSFDSEIIKIAQTFDLKTFSGDIHSFKFKHAPLGLSVHYPRVLRKELIRKYNKIYNLHPSFLPWGRGYYPIFWALWEQSPVGATLHEITEGLDEGPIVDQIEVECYHYDTGGTMFNRVRAAEKELFSRYICKILAGEAIPVTQQPVGGSFHSKKDFFDLKRSANWSAMRGGELVRLIQCLTFPGFSGLEISFGEKKFELHLEPLEKDVNTES